MDQDKQKKQEQLKLETLFIKKYPSDWFDMMFLVNANATLPVNDGSEAFEREMAETRESFLREIRGSFERLWDEFMRPALATEKDIVSLVVLKAQIQNFPAKYIMGYRKDEAEDKEVGIPRLVIDLKRFRKDVEGAKDGPE